MSYCRWSSEDWSSDLYCYADVSGGYTSHVARNRTVFAESLPDLVVFPTTRAEEDEERFERELAAWYDRRQRVLSMVADAERVSIVHPDAGATFNDPTPGACADRLERLRAEGFVVPQYAIDRLREEQTAGEV